MFCAVLAPALAAAQAGVEVSNAWTRATAPGAKVGGVYMDIKSAGAAKLVSASSTAAARTEIHSMKMEGGVMKMSPVEVIDLAAGHTVKLAPGGYHVMLLDLKQPLKAGDKVSVTLTIERADKSRATVDVNAEVRDMSGAAKGGGMAHDAHKGH